MNDMPDEIWADYGDLGTDYSDVEMRGKGTGTKYIRADTVSYNYEQRCKLEEENQKLRAYGDDMAGQLMILSGNRNIVAKEYRARRRQKP